MNASRSGDRPGGRWRGGMPVAWCALVAVMLWAYWPSFDQLPRKDQLYVHAEFSRTESLGDMLSLMWSYNRKRTVMPSDTPLFRPGTFLPLAIQKYFFDYRTELWKIVSLAIHLLVAITLFRVIRGIFVEGSIPTGPPETMLPFLAAAFFTLNAAVADTVSWEHIQGYMVFTGLILLALGLIQRIEAGGQSPLRAREAWPVAGVLTLACFFHEAGAVIALLFGMFFALSGLRAGGGFWKIFGAQWRARAALALIFVLPPLIYASASVLDYAANAPHVIREEQIQNWAERMRPDLALASFSRLVAYCGAQPLFPPSFHVLATHARVHPSEALNVSSNLPMALKVLVLALALAVAGGVAYLSVAGIRKGRWFPALVASTGAAYLAIYSVLRLSVRSQMHPNFLGLNSQYAYFGCGITLVVAALAWREFLASQRPLVPVVSRWIALAYLTVMTAVSTVQTRMFNHLLAEDDLPARRCIVEPARRGMAAARQSGIRRFAFLNEFSHPAEYSYAHGIPLHTVLFGRLESDDPEAVILLPSGRVSDDPALIEQWRRGLKYRRTLPMDVLEVRQGGRAKEYHTSYVLYEDADGWVGFLSSFPPGPRERARNYPFAVVADDESGAVAACQRRAREAAAAFHANRLAIFRGGMLEVLGQVAGFQIFNVRGEFLAVPLKDRLPSLKEITSYQVPGMLMAASLEDLATLIRDQAGVDQ